MLQQGLLWTVVGHIKVRGRCTVAEVAAARRIRVGEFAADGGTPHGGQQRRRCAECCCGEVLAGSLRRGLGSDGRAHHEVSRVAVVLLSRVTEDRLRPARVRQAAEGRGGAKVQGFGDTRRACGIGLWEPVAVELLEGRVVHVLLPSGRTAQRVGGAVSGRVQGGVVDGPRARRGVLQRRSSMRQVWCSTCQCPNEWMSKAGLEAVERGMRLRVRMLW